MWINGLRYFNSLKSILCFIRKSVAKALQRTVDLQVLG